VRQTEHAPRNRSQPEGAAPGHGPCDGRLIPWADPFTGELGWTVLTASRDLAATVAAMSGGRARPDEKGQWHARIPEPALAVTVTDADSAAFRCRLSARPDSGVLAVAITPWTVATVVKCPVTALPAGGTLTVRDARMTTRMGRTVRYLIPQFTPI
jgi:hypothetical protein